MIDSRRFRRLLRSKLVWSSAFAAAVVVVWFRQATAPRPDAPRTVSKIEKRTEAPTPASRTLDSAATFPDVSADDDELSDDEELVRGGREADAAPLVSSAASLSTVSKPFTPVLPQSARDDAARQRSDDLDQASSREVTVNDMLAPLSEGINSGGSNFRSGIRVRNGSGGGTNEVADEIPPEDNAVVDIGELPWVGGQARGYTMLYAMQPQARQVVERQVRALVQSRLREPHVGILIDGTFGRDFDYLTQIMTQLTSDGRALALTLYLSNGATMRRYDSTPITALFARIQPELFRNLIRYDRNVRARYSRIVSDAAQVFRLNKEFNPQSTNAAVIMLEDNLDRDSYRAMRALAQGALASNATLIRNPCVGCYDGNDGDSLGSPREEHTLTGFSTLGAGDSFSLDGLGFSYPGEGASQAVSYPQLLDLLRDAKGKQLRYVGIWRTEWQGNVEGREPLHPDRRTYSPSTEQELVWEIEALRHGLAEETPIPEAPAAVP